MTYIKLALFVSLFIVSYSVSVDLPVAESQIYKCDRKANVYVRCSTEFTGACAYFNDGKSFKLNQRYTANGCIACNDNSVKFYEDGKCEGSKVYCDKNFRPQFCTMEWNPVCAYSTDNKGKAARRTAGSDCSACSDATIDYYVRGECPN